MSSSRAKMVRALVIVLGLVASNSGSISYCLPAVHNDQGQNTKSPAATTDPRREVGRIADHIKENYARIRTLSVLLQTKNVDRSVAKREEVTNNLPDGTIVQFVRQPFSVRRERIQIAGDELRRAVMDEDGEIWGFRRGVWTQYLPRQKTAWLRSPDQMPGMLPLDPRNIASLEQRLLFVDRLRGDRVLEIGPTRTPDGQPRIATLMEHAFDQVEYKERYRCEFDPARNDLPTRIVVLREGDKIGIVLDINYQEVIPGTAWFFEKATCKFFEPELARSPDSEAWRQALIVETKGNLHVNEPIDAEAIAVKLPPGTQISDSTRFVNHAAP